MGKERAASLPQCDACVRKPPHACRPRHAHPSTPRRARGSSKAQRAKSFTAVKTAPSARAPFWAWPNNVSRLCVAQAWRLLSVYERGGAPLYPFTCARAVGAAPTVAPSRTGEVSQGKTEAQDNQSNAKAKTTKSSGTSCRGNLSSPGKILAGEARPTPTERATLEPAVPNAIINMGPGLEKAPLWWHSDLCEDIFKIR